MQQRQVRGQRGCGRKATEAIKTTIKKKHRDTGTNEDTGQSWTPRTRRTTGNQETAAPSAKATRDVAGANADPKKGTGKSGNSSSASHAKDPSPNRGISDRRSNRSTALEQAQT